MYSIGMFSQLGRVTTKTLRHYDEIGLLKPVRIDPDSGYRYYSADQLPRLNRILAFKQMGLSLAEIVALLEASPETVTRLLSLKRRQAQESAARERQRILLIDNFLDVGKGFFMNSLTAMIKVIPSVCVACKTQVLPGFGSIRQAVAEMMAEMDAAGCRCAEPDYWFNVYLDGEYRERDIRVEICRAVTKPGAESPSLVFKTLPDITAACALNKGSYARLGETYAFTVKWIEENGYQIVGNPRESYIAGAWNAHREEDYLTEVQFPVQKAK